MAERFSVNSESHSQTCWFLSGSRELFLLSSRGLNLSKAWPHVTCLPIFAIVIFIIIAKSFLGPVLLQTVQTLLCHKSHSVLPLRSLRDTKRAIVTHWTVCLLYEEKGRFPVSRCEPYKAIWVYRRKRAEDRGEKQKTKKKNSFHFGRERDAG